MKQSITSAITSPSCSKHNMHRDSHTISKLKPKIRIIHIIAPEIIKTDVVNFRDLVQRLTGKNATQVKEKKLKRDKSQRKKIESPQHVDHFHHQQQHMNMLQDTSTNYRMKEEEGSEGIYGSSVENSSNGYLSGFGSSMEVSFIQDFGDYPLYPNFKPTHIDMFGHEMPLC